MSEFDETVRAVIASKQPKEPVIVYAAEPVGGGAPPTVGDVMRAEREAKESVVFMDAVFREHDGVVNRHLGIWSGGAES